MVQSYSNNFTKINETFMIKEKSKSIKITEVLLLVSIASAFLPYSWQTPLGFISPVDISLMNFLVYASLRSRGIINLRMLKGIAIAAVCFLIFCISQSSMNPDGSISIFVKYATFLLVIPIAIAFANYDFHKDTIIANSIRVCAISGLILSIITLILIFLGQYRSSQGGEYYIIIFDQTVQKNALASLIIYSAICSYGTYAINQNKLFLISFAIQVFVTFLIGARSAIIIELITATIIFYVFSRLSVARKILYIASIVAFVSISVGMLISSGFFSDQISRLTEAFSTDTSSITASTSRLLLWQFAWDKIGQSPLIGYGSGNFNFEGSGGWLDGMYEPHDNILQILYSFGIIGFLAFAAVLAFGFRKKAAHNFQKLCTIILVAYLGNTLVGIIWVRGDGHLFWLFFFLRLASVSANLVNVPSQTSLLKS